MIAKNFKTSRYKNRQEGLASLVATGVLVVLITLISIAFARLMNRSVQNSANNQFSSAATYAAQSAINDVATYIKQPGNENAFSDKCTGPGSLIGNDSSPPGSHGPFFKDSDLSSDGGRDTSYTCLLLDQTPSDLKYDVELNSSAVVKLTTTTGNVDKLMISWESLNGTTGLPASSGNFPSISTWNSNKQVPLLRVTIYPVPASHDLDPTEASAKTVFLYPKDLLDNSPQFKNFADINNGQVWHVNCNSTNVPPGQFDGSADYRCNVVIDQLIAGVPGTDYLYARVTPLYNNARVKLKVNDASANSLKFKNVQAVVDATAQSGGTAKRLQARLNLSNDANKDDSNYPENALRSANVICKRWVLNNSPPLPPFATQEVNNPKHCGTSGGESKPPAPNLDLFINDPAVGDIESAIVPSGRPPAYPGTAFIGYGASTTINWKTDFINNCSGNVGTGDAGWGGPKPLSIDPLTFKGSGNYSAQSLTGVTQFRMTCVSVDGSSIPQKTVTAWPEPRVTLARANPNPVTAGGSYTLTWASVNAVRCDVETIASPADTAWNQNNIGTSGTKATAIFTRVNDNAPKTYRFTCFDPINRSHSLDVTVTMARPTCDANTDVVNQNDGTVLYRWWGSCPTGNNSSLATFRLEGGINASAAPNGGWFRTGFIPGQTFCLDLVASLAPWGDLDRGHDCDRATLPPPRLELFQVDRGNGFGRPPVASWVNVSGCSVIAPDNPGCQPQARFQWPQCADTPTIPFPFNLSWYCARAPQNANGKGTRTTTYNGGNPLNCADAVHSVTICGVQWRATEIGYAGNNYPGISCTLSANNFRINQVNNMGPTGSMGKLGWLGSTPGVPLPANLKILCVGFDGKTTDQNALSVPSYWGPFSADSNGHCTRPVICN